MWAIFLPCASASSRTSVAATRRVGRRFPDTVVCILRIRNDTAMSSCAPARGSPGESQKTSTTTT